MSAASYSAARPAVVFEPTASLRGGSPPALRNSSTFGVPTRRSVALTRTRRNASSRYGTPLRCEQPPTNSRRGSPVRLRRGTGPVMGITPQGTRYSFDAGTPCLMNESTTHCEGATMASASSYSATMRSTRRGWVSGASGPNRRCSSARSSVCVTACAEPTVRTAGAPRRCAARMLSSDMLLQPLNRSHTPSIFDAAASNATLTAIWFPAWTPRGPKRCTP